MPSLTRHLFASLLCVALLSAPAAAFALSDMEGDFGPDDDMMIDMGADDDADQDFDMPDDDIDQNIDMPDDDMDLDDIDQDFDMPDGDVDQDFDMPDDGIDQNIDMPDQGVDMPDGGTDPDMMDGGHASPDQGEDPDMGSLDPDMNAQDSADMEDPCVDYLNDGTLCDDFEAGNESDQFDYCAAGLDVEMYCENGKWDVKDDMIVDASDDDEPTCMTTGAQDGPTMPFMLLGMLIGGALVRRRRQL